MTFERVIAYVVFFTICSLVAGLVAAALWMFGEMDADIAILMFFAVDTAAMILALKAFPDIGKKAD